ncbi:MAG TPA: Bax inhibitor-1 family protein, partial [Bacteroidia bacterium]|nr:Bax inhibitor-1 family protein [Bacteroidia bacterium]
MSNDNFSYMNTQESESLLVKTFLTRVFTWMCVALAISGLVAWIFGTQPELTSMLFVQTLRGYAPTGLGFAAMFLPLLFIFAINMGLQKFSLPVLLGLFIAFSIAMGMSLSSIFFLYQFGAITKTF